MGSSRRTARRRRAPGVIPSMVKSVWRGTAWMIRHPQTMLMAAALGGFGWSVWRYFQRSDTFLIANVILSPDAPLTITQPLIGENLLAIDIRQLSEDLKRQQPSLKDVQVIRQLPNTLRIVPVQRTPVAQLQLERWYPVDDQGFIVPEASPEPHERLVRLVGIDRKSGTVRAGQENSDEKLQLALRVLKTVRRAPISVSRRVVEVNVVDPQQIRFLMDSDTEVRCGTEAELDAHLQRLKGALQAIARQSMDVQYIDVRFHEPVVHPRTS
jgi:cell division septal protein FtsQ